MEIHEKLIGILKSPSKIFRNIEEEGIQETMFYFAAMLVIQLFTFVLINLNYIGKFYEIVLMWLEGIAMFFVVAVLMHLFVMLLKVNHEWDKYFLTLKVPIYAATPFILLGWIPYVSIIGSVWLVYLLTKGISTIYSVKMSRAFLVAILPFVLFIIIGILRML